MERSEEKRHASYLNMIDAVERLSRGEEMSEEWEFNQMCEVRELTRYCSDFSQVNLERQDKEFRAQATSAHLALQSLLTSFDARVYLTFCQCILRLLSMLDEDDDLVESFAKLRH